MPTQIYWILFLIYFFVFLVGITFPLAALDKIIYITRQVLGRPVCDQGAIPENEKLYANYFAAFNFSVTAELNDVTSRLIILINEEINEANCMVRNSAKLDRRTKQHTQFGVSTSDGSRDMARTKIIERGQKPYSIPYGDR